VTGLPGADGKTDLAPLLPSSPPNATRSVSVTVSFQSTSDGRFLGFVNNTSWEPLSGQSTLLAVRKDPTGYAPIGSGVGAVDQLLFTVDSIQVVDLRVVRPLTRVSLSESCSLTSSRKDNLDDGDHPFHLHGHRPWMYVDTCNRDKFAGVAISDSNKPEWEEGKDAISDKGSTQRHPSPATRSSYQLTVG